MGVCDKAKKQTNKKQQQKSPLIKRLNVLKRKWEEEEIIC